MIKERDEAALPQSGDGSSPTSRAASPAAARSTRSPPTATASGGRTARNAPRAEPAPPTKAARIPGAKKARLPADPRPQLASAADQAPDGPQWFHEIKYDGYRLIARIGDGTVRLLTRNGLDWTAKISRTGREARRIAGRSGADRR